MIRAKQLDMRAIRRDYERTHTGTGNMALAGRGRQKIDLTDAEAEFGHAVDRYKRENRRPIPTFGEVLAVLVALGYRQVAEPAPVRAAELPPATPAVPTPLFDFIDRP